LPAGKLDKGEDPEVCARRELKEETGLEADKIKHILSFYSGPGFTMKYCMYMPPSTS